MKIINIIKKPWVQQKQTWQASWELGKMDFKLKNEGTWLGLLWHFLNPIFYFFLLFFIFYDRLGKNIENYPLYLISGIILFSYFQRVTNEAVLVAKKKNNIIKNINIKKEILVQAIIIKNLLIHIVEFFIFLIFIFFLHTNTVTIIFYPIILLLLIIFSFGISLILTTLGAWIFDLNQIWGHFIRLVWLGTPIFYNIEGQIRLGLVNTFNPIYYYITLARQVIVYKQIPDTNIIIGVLIFSFGFFILGKIIFTKLEYKLPEII